MLRLWEVAFVVNGFKQLIHKWLSLFLKKYIQLVYTKGFKFLFTFVLFHQRNNVLGECRRVCITDGLEGFRQPCFQGIEVFNDHLRSSRAFPLPPPQLKLAGLTLFICLKAQPTLAGDTRSFSGLWRGCDAKSDVSSAAALTQAKVSLVSTRLFRPRAWCTTPPPSLLCLLSKHWLRGRSVASRH